MSTRAAAAELENSWAPMIVIAVAQIMLIFNVSTLQVSMEGIATSFSASATMIGTAIVTYALVVAALIMPCARIVQTYGSRVVFRTAVLLFGAGMGIMAISPGVTLMLIAQVVAGCAAAALVPTLVVLVTENYQGRQKEKALALLGGAPAIGIVLAFLIAGSLATLIGWRFMFGLLFALAIALYYLGDKLRSSASPSDIHMDWMGAALAAAAILLMSLGANNLTRWGSMLATPLAPFSILDMSPAPIMILCGIFLLQAFVTWSRRRAKARESPLVALEVFDTPQERAALFSILIISALASAITFLLPLYTQVVQGRSSLETAVTVIPFSLASFVAAVLVVRLYPRSSPSRIARNAFLLVAAGVALLAATIRNDWSDPVVMLGMATAGLGEGALVTLLFNVLVTASPGHLAGDVGSVRGATNNLATAVGTALAGALVTSLLGAGVHKELVHNATIPQELKSEVNLDDVSFISNDQLRQKLASTTASQEHIAEAMRINTETRLLALKLALFAFAGLALLAYFPAGSLPREAGEVRGKEV
jgi:predicted MFS family arabinose efflux permease